MLIAATDGGAPYGPTPRRQSGATTEHAACRSPAQETSRAATTSPPCPSFASPAPPRSPRTTSARHRRSDPSGPHRSPAPQWGASDGLMRRLVRWAASRICPQTVTSHFPPERDPDRIRVSGDVTPFADVLGHERARAAGVLAGVHIGIISIERADGPPLTVPIWYGYEPGAWCGSSPVPNPSREGC